MKHSSEGSQRTPKRLAQWKSWVQFITKMTTCFSLEQTCNSTVQKKICVYIFMSLFLWLRIIFTLSSAVNTHLLVFFFPSENTSLGERGTPLGPWQWKHQVLTTGLQGNFPKYLTKSWYLLVNGCKHYGLRRSCWLVRRHPFSFEGSP